MTDFRPQRGDPDPILLIDAEGRAVCSLPGAAGDAARSADEYTYLALTIMARSGGAQTAAAGVVFEPSSLPDAPMLPRVFRATSPLPDDAFMIRQPLNLVARERSRWQRVALAACARLDTIWTRGAPSLVGIGRALQPQQALRIWDGDYGRGRTYAAAPDAQPRWPVGTWVLFGQGGPGPEGEWFLPLADAEGPPFRGWE